MTSRENSRNMDFKLSQPELQTHTETKAKLKHTRGRPGSGVQPFTGKHTEHVWTTR